MKRKRFILTALAMVTGAGLAIGATNEVSTLLQKGLFEEEANRNLDAAIKEYQAVVTQTDKDRQFAATAIFRLGECYRKQGKTNEANEQYRRVLREFPDQTELAKLSREYAGPGEATAPASNPEGVPTLQGKIAAAEAAIHSREREFRELSDRKTARVFALQHFPNPVLTSLMQDAVKTEQELARMKSDLGDKHPDVARTQETLNIIHEQIDAQVRGIMKDAQAKLSDAQAALEDLKKRAAETSKEVAAFRPQEQPLTKPSEEDQTIKRLQAILRDSPDLINANDSSGVTPLNSAVRSGQLQVVKFLLDNKANIETRDGTTFTPLLSAAESEHRDVVELLLDRGADVNASALVGRDQRFSSWPIRHGYAALHYAAASGNKAIAELLLAHGAKVDAQDASGATPLMVAVEKGFKSVAEMLIARGADVNARNNEGKSVLIVAIEKNRPYLIEMLLASKADVNLASQDGYTPLIAAVNAGQPETVKLLLEHGADARAKMAENHASTPRWTALDAAVVMNDNASVKLLLENHADPNATFDLSDRGNVYEHDSTPLILAAEHKHADSAAILLAHGADVNGRNARGTTALWQAALSKDDRSMAELLLNNKADTEIKYEHDQTVLELAVIYGKTEMVELLLAHGANINAQNIDGQTALHLAAYAGTRPMVELLLAHGADVNLKDNQGNTALDLAGSSHGAGFAPAPGRPRSGPSPAPFAVSATGTAPLTYQWNFNGSGANEGQEDTNTVAGLLRQHGGLAEVDISTIRVGRPASELAVVFKNGADGHNHFTMFDLIAQVYAPPNWDPWKSDPWQSGKLGSEPPGLRFPDFSKIKIIRLGAGGPAKTISVDLGTALASGDCGMDVPLKWGDIVEIPEADHKVNEHWTGLDEAVRATLKKCLQSKVDIVVKGVTNQVTLTTDAPFNINGLSWHGSRGDSSGPSTKTELWTSWLNEVVHQANVILYSSDLTRVKVERTNPQTHKAEEMVFNLDKHPYPLPPTTSPVNDLWLRDGDVIVIPEKQ